MSTTRRRRKTPSTDAGADAPLALHITRHRQWHGSTPMSRRQLAHLSGIPEASLARLERSRKLHPEVEVLLSVAASLGVAPSDLLAPWASQAIASQIAERKTACELGLGTGCDDEACEGHED